MQSSYKFYWEKKKTAEDKVGMPLALRQEGAAAHLPAHPVIQHMRNTKPGTTRAAPHRQETRGRITEATRENMWRENSTGGEDCLRRERGHPGDEGLW